MSTAKHSTTEHHFAHHFNSAEHEFDTSKFGVWLFLCTEILMFGGLFVAYAIYHNVHPEIFIEGSKFLDWRMGALNTVVLLVSSFTMALGIHYSQKNQRSKAVLNLGITLVCGLIFLVVKYIEYSHKIHLGLLPGNLFSFEGAASGANLPMYFSFYFCMTGLHGIHVLIGMGLILWVLLRARKGEFSADYYTPVEGVGLFWHLVDLIWIYLFPLLYLVG
ncbi:MAG: cytochrome c oxidase subunit 3 family protein [Bdellovibrionales bacterium]|nr:cytochrome c oxidase subunit 3 family protein [Bdellovibrionales bacterium]